jgi:predicted DNA-binding WGR domain protein
VEQKNQPAMEQQKQKLAFFGCTWTGQITVGQASEALLQCARDFPDREAAWIPRRPAVSVHSKEGDAWLDAWLPLPSHERLKKRQEQSERIAPEEVTIQDTASRQNKSPSEYLIPAREVHDSEPRRPAVCETERITLYYREGSSDKVYQASIEAQGAWFVVNFAYGRRGSTMYTGTKTQTPVDYHSAKYIYDKLVWEKKANGYTDGPGGSQPKRFALQEAAKSRDASPQEIIPEPPTLKYVRFCPVCDSQIEVEAAMIGNKQACPHCQSEITPVFTRTVPRAKTFQSPTVKEYGQPKQFALDMARVDEITNETKEVVSILSAMMEDESEKSVALPASITLPAPEIPNVSSDGKAAPTRYKGLDAAFHPILERLMARDSWPQTDFKALAVEFHVMPLKIHETLNEWSDEALGDFILEGEDPVLIHRELMA